MAGRSVPSALLPWGLSMLGVDESSGGLVPVAGDASTRRYFRFVHGGVSYVLAEAPPASENNEAFVRVQALLAQAGVRVPALLGVDYQRGYLLLEDLGDRLLLPALTPEAAADCYHRAFDVLLHLNAAGLEGSGLGAYDRTLLAEELSRFPEWFAERLLGCRLDKTESGLIEALHQQLIGSALEQPTVLVHRDFHSRNLMLLSADELALIDFQDAVIGPVTYDLVSLLRDCYIQWPPAQVEAWALAYRERLLARGQLSGVSEETFLRWFDWMGLQRHLKVLGTFARLYLRDGKAAYLADLPLVMAYVLQILDRYAPEVPVFATFAHWFRQSLLPLAQAQDWGPSS
jgi:N-acetylmuramate 1-kinase